MCNLGFSLHMCYLIIDVIFTSELKWLSDPLVTSLQILSQYAAVYEAFIVYESPLSQYIVIFKFGTIPFSYLYSWFSSIFKWALSCRVERNELYPPTNTCQAPHQRLQ